MVVTSYDNLVKPGDKLVSLHKVVTSCHKTLHKFEINCCKTWVFCCCCCYQVPACDMHVLYMVCTGLKNMHVPLLATCMQHKCFLASIDMQHAHCVLHACCMLRPCCMHVVLLIHVAIFFALPYNYNIFMTRACPV